MGTLLAQLIMNTATIRQLRGAEQARQARLRQSSDQAKAKADRLRENKANELNAYRDLHAEDVTAVEAQLEGEREAQIAQIQTALDSNSEGVVELLLQAVTSVDTDIHRNVTLAHAHAD